MTDEGFCASHQHLSLAVALSKCGIHFSDERTLAHACGESFFRLFTSGDRPFEISSMTWHIRIETSVLIDPAYLCGEDCGQALILFAEFITAYPVNEANIPI